MIDLAVTNAQVVLPDRVLPTGSVLIRDGLIAEVVAALSTDAAAAVRTLDARGAYLVPGLIDLHNDGLEFEVNPRPRANLALPMAFAAYERRLAGCGVTTEFHAISFMEDVDTVRSVAGAASAATYIGELQRRGSGAVSHQVLARINVWAPEHLDTVFDSIAGLEVRYVSLNDHTPGQGQFGDVERYVQWMTDYYNQRGAAGLDVDQMHRTMASRAADTETLPAVYARVLAEARRAPLVLATHDDDSPGKVDLGADLGARVAEYPVTIAAAERARERGLAIVVGAPNIVRGGSQSGNLDARQLIELDLADVISADYHAPSLLPAAFRLVEDGLRDLPAAIRMLTLNPARAVGLLDRGAILPGQRADLALIRRTEDDVPVVEALFRSGQQVFSFQPAMLAAVGQAASTRSG